MPTARQRPQFDEHVSIDGVGYLLAPDNDSPSVDWKTIPTQPGDANVEFERRLINLALGWGNSKWVPGGYDYANSAILHRRNSWLPGSAVTDRTSDMGGSAAGATSFCEYWDPASPSNRVLVIVTRRHVIEYNVSGVYDVNDLGVNFTSTRGMTKGVSFRASGMSNPVIFVARQSTSSTDYFVERTAVGTWAVTSANKVAQAFAPAKDAEGADVLARVDENGKLNMTTADSNPQAGASWASAVFPIGPNTGRANDMAQQARTLIVGRDDMLWTFDNVTNAIPITMGMDQTPSQSNFKYIKDFNGMAVMPTAQGLIWVDGLEWGTCGPVSANPLARSLRGTETAVSDQAGNYIYCAAYHGGNSYIFLGTTRKEEETGNGPFAWHGPIASVAYQVTDLRVCTVVANRLWIGGTDSDGDARLGSIELNADFSPKPDAASGYIYLPEGAFDMAGPGVIKDFRKAEFIAPASAPFSSTNKWSIEIETTPGSGTYVAIDGGAVSSGVYAERFWSTETSGRRLRGRLVYTDNGGSAELEGVLIRGTERPETTEEYTIRLELADSTAKPSGNRRGGIARTDSDRLRALVDSGRVTTIVLGNASFTGRVTAMGEVQRVPQGVFKSPKRVVTILVRRIKTS